LCAASAGVRWGRVDKPASPQDLVRIQEGLFLAIRKDLGHDTKKLPPGTLLRLFLNDEK
jgi:hypothetical protein